MLEAAIPNAEDDNKKGSSNSELLILSFKKPLGQRKRLVKPQMATKGKVTRTADNLRFTITSSLQKFDMMESHAMGWDDVVTFIIN